MCFPISMKKEILGLRCPGAIPSTKATSREQGAISSLFPIGLQSFPISYLHELQEVETEDLNLGGVFKNIRQDFQNKVPKNKVFHRINFEKKKKSYFFLTYPEASKMAFSPLRKQGNR